MFESNLLSVVAMCCSAFFFFSSQGLCYDGGFLYESTGLYGGKSTVRKVDTETGEVLQSVKLDDKYFGEGMVIIDDKVTSQNNERYLAFLAGVGVMVVGCRSCRCYCNCCCCCGCYMYC